MGIRFLVAPTLLIGTLAPLQEWADVADTTQAQSQVAVGDVNRDGMEDVVILLATGATGSELVGLISTGTHFSRVSMWTSDSFQESASKIAAADLNGDGRGDPVVLYDAGSARTRLYEFGGVLFPARVFRARSLARVERDPALLTRVTP